MVLVSLSAREMHLTLYGWSGAASQPKVLGRRPDIMEHKIPRNVWASVCASWWLIIKMDAGAVINAGVTKLCQWT